ncbi:MAG: sugar-specific transcriptional regulator TrmB [Candidatus Woesearchaeota archaeon]|jgi:sugar-specific transcriptional regulator TrmB
MHKELLAEIGLTNTEAQVYLAMLELGSSSTGKIVDESGASSSKIYEILDRLMKKGLANYVMKGGVKYFEAASPERIVEYMQEKQKQLFAQTKKIQSIVPELKLKQESVKNKSEATVYKGLKGVHAAFYGALERAHKGDEFSVMGIPKRTPTETNFFVKFAKDCEKKQIPKKSIYNETARENVDAHFIKSKLSDVKFMPQKTPASTSILGDTVFIFPTVVKEPLVIAIENKEVAESFQVQFNHWWNQDFVIVNGFEDVFQTMRSFLDSIGEGGHYDVYGASLGSEKSENLYLDFFTKYHAYRMNKQITVRLLFQKGRENIVTKLRDTLYTKGAQVKHLGYEVVTPVATFTSKEKTILLIQDAIPVAIIIDNKWITASFQAAFDTEWSKDVHVKKGIADVKEIFMEMIESGSADFIGAEGYFIKHDPKWIKQWEKLAIKNKFVMRNVADPSVKGKRISKFPFAQTKYTLHRDFSDMSVFWLYNNKVAICNWADDEPTIVVMENPKIVKMYKTQFETLWNKS